MTVYTCEPNLEAMLSCIYDAWASGKGHRNIRLALEPVGQYSFMDEYIHVDEDSDKARKVMDAVCLKISQYVYSELTYTGMAYEEDALDNIYHVMILGFAYGPNVLDMVHYKDVMRNREIRVRLEKEVCGFKDFTRFHEVKKSVYVAHIEPKSRLLPMLAEHFEDRMPSEHWMIIDDIHKEAVVHPKDEHYYFWKLNDDEFEQLLVTENENDEYTDMWKTFFDSIAIKERKNIACQNNLFPKWKRKHAVEFL